MSNFFVFMCPQCRNFTNAPVGQKRRRCSYCGKIIDISKAAVVLIDGQNEASAAVKQFNASRGGDEFEKAVERSKERVKSLVPRERISIKDLTREEVQESPTGKTARLLELLESHAKERPLSMTELEEHSETAQLDWSWVEKQLTKMANDGVLIFPRPWTVRLVKLPVTNEKPVESMHNVSDAIIMLLRTEKEGLDIEYLITHFKQLGISPESVISSLEKLMSMGEIYEPRHGHVNII